MRLYPGNSRDSPSTVLRATVTTLLLSRTVPSGFSRILWLHAWSSLGVHVILVLSPNYWVLTEMVDSTHLSVCLTAYINIRSCKFRFRWMADSTVQSLSSSGRIVKIPIWYIPNTCAKWSQFVHFSVSLCSILQNIVDESIWNFLKWHALV